MLHLSPDITKGRAMDYSYALAIVGFFVILGVVMMWIGLRGW